MARSPPPHAPRPNGTRPLTIVADDFGLAPGVSDAIADLIEAGRLSGTGAMVTMGDFPRAAAMAGRLRAKGAIGLHLTFTDQPALTASDLAPDGRFFGPATVYRLGLSGGLPDRLVAAEMRAQLHRFEDLCGFAPHFVDGHHHVHALPAVRRALFRLFDEGALDANATWIRDPAITLGDLWRIRIAWPKAALVSALGLGLGRKARARGLATNRGFAGIYDYGRATDFASAFRRFLKIDSAAPLIMVHPGRVDAALEAVDRLTTAREAERDYLASEAFVDDVARAGFRLTRGRVAEFRLVERI